MLPNQEVWPFVLVHLLLKGLCVRPVDQQVEFPLKETET